MIQILSQEMLLNLRRLAVKNIKSQTIAQFIEDCYRHYSKTYHTPLHIAKQVMPIEETVLIYMEDEMKDLTPDEIEDWLKEFDGKVRFMIEPKSVYKEQTAEISDDAWIAEQEAALKKKEAAEKSQKQEDMIAQTHKAMENFKTKITKFTEAIEGNEE